MVTIVSLSVIIVAIYILSVITDEFFVTSLDQISRAWKIPPDVAGASLMAMGSSAPELSIAVLALFKEGGTHSDVGIGTIVGSAVFNILVITGISAIIRDARVTLPAVARDTVFYLISIGFLLYAFWDGEITLVESFFFIVLYAGYIAFLFLVPVGGELETSPAEEKEEKEITEQKSRFQGIHNLIEKGIGFLAGDAETSYGRAFVVSIALIAGLSWILVDSAIIFADSLGIPPVIVALTILAGGTSAPDLIASIVVAKQGKGSMAVANAIGSNIFDILVCLGLPWMIALLFLDQPVIHVGTQDLLTSILILVSTVIILFIFLFTDRLLTKKEGWCLLGIYVAYVLWTLSGG
ncbi:calcium/sodium antiporter [Desulfobacterales bacterium HSG2]|nr:calcium/sodium antiporter [Desulfobacterales bacterium HSG2]